MLVCVFASGHRKQVKVMLEFLHCAVATRDGLNISMARRNVMYI